MRGIRSTLFLLVLLLGVGAYIYFVESKRDPVSETGEKREKVFADLDAGKITEVKVVSASGESATLARTDDAWQMVEPVKAKADESEVSGLTSSLASLEIQRVVEDAPTDLAQYGLEKPHADISFKPEGSKEMKRILIGEKTATGGDLYAKLADQKRVFLIPGYLESTFARTPFDLRDKAILTVERDKVDSIEITRPSGSIQLVKGDVNAWKLQKPWQTAADPTAVEALMSRLTAGQMKAITANEVGDLKQYGLDKPVISVGVGSGSSRATLELGKPAPTDGQIFARDVSRPMIFTVESTMLTDLDKDAADLRRKDLFEFRPFNGNNIELARPGAPTVAFEKVKGNGKEVLDKWRRTQPVAGELDGTKIEDFLSKVANLRAQTFLESEPKSTAAPILTVTVKFDEGKKQERVTLTRAGTEIHASAGEPAPPARVDTKEFDDLVQALDELAK